MDVHPSHVLRFSIDSSVWDEMCINCGANDGGRVAQERLAEPCVKPVGGGGITIKEWYKKDEERALRMEEILAKM